MFIKIFTSLTRANRVALFKARSFANEIDDIASKPIIIANHFTYSSLLEYPIVDAIFSLNEYISKINNEEENNNEIREVLNTTLLFFSF